MACFLQASSRPCSPATRCSRRTSTLLHAQTHEHTCIRHAHDRGQTPREHLIYMPDGRLAVRRACPESTAGLLSTGLPRQACVKHQRALHQEHPWGGRKEENAWREAAAHVSSLRRTTITQYFPRTGFVKSMTGIHSLSPPVHPLPPKPPPPPNPPTPPPPRGAGAPPPGGDGDGGLADADPVAAAHACGRAYAG